jgi:hypothetical protein
VTPPAEGTQSAQSPQKEWVSSRASRVLRSLLVLAVLGTSLSAHDLEHTQVTIVFARDGSFVADVANDPAWLKLRLETIPGPFADRVVMWVDGREIRPESVEFIPFDSHALAQGRTGEGPAIHRLRGHVPLNAQTLRWFYGLVIDPYPLTIRRADGRIVAEEIGGNAWSRTIDLSGQFHGPTIGGRVAGMFAALLLLLPVALRFRSHLKGTKATEAAKESSAPP